jgi:hypothetical protein
VSLDHHDPRYRPRDVDPLDASRNPSRHGRIVTDPLARPPIVGDALRSMTVSKAIEEACRRIYGGQEPRLWRTLIGWRLGGPEPLEEIRCYEAGDHWHWMGRGLSDLHDEDPSELTFRLARGPGETHPPTWPVELLQGLARRAVTGGGGLRAGDLLELGGPLGPDEDTALRALLFAADPELGAEPRSLRFVQAFGITLDELAAARDWQCDPFTALVRERNPRLVTDVARRSHRADPGFERAVQAGIDRDGSSCGTALADVVHWSKDRRGGVRLEIDTRTVPELVRALRGRIPFGRPFRLTGPEETIVLWPDGVERGDDELGDDALYVDLSPELAAVVRGTFEDARSREALAGEYTWEELPGLTLVVDARELAEPDPDAVGASI